MKWGIDLSSEHERYLAERVFKSPVIVFNYPKDIKVPVPDFVLSGLQDVFVVKQSHTHLALIACHALIACNNDINHQTYCASSCASMQS